MTNKRIRGVNVKEKVTIVTDNDDWAEQAFDFHWGHSTPTERLRALEELVGTQAELIRIAGIEGTAYKMALKRGSAMPMDRIDAIAQGTRVSLDYLVRGTPTTARDAECEEKRFDIAARDFALPSSAARRESRQLLIAQRRLEVEDQIAQLTGSGVADSGTAFRHESAPEGYALIAPLRLTVRVIGTSRLQTAEPGPVALSTVFLSGHGYTADGLRIMTIEGDEGGTDFSPGSVVIIDTTDRAPRQGAVYAMDIGGEIQLRRTVVRLSGKTELVHVNPAWPVEVIDVDDPLPVLGTAVFSLSKC